MASASASIPVRWSNLAIYSNFFSPKPELPSKKDYEAPPSPSRRDLGPPPPGYGRYSDYDSVRGPNVGQGSINSVIPTGQARRNLDDVLCFKVKLLQAKFYIAVIESH